MNNLDESFTCCSFDSLDHEYKVRVGWDRANRSVAVCGVRGADNPNLLVDVQMDSHLVPAFDDLTPADPDIQGLSPIVAGVELGAIDEGAIIVHGDCITIVGLGASITLIKHLDRVFLDQFFREL